MKRRFVFPSVFLSAILLAPSAYAADANVKSKFSVYFKGVPVGVFSSSVEITGNRYSINGKAKTNKFVSVIASSKARFSASGTISGNKIVPDENAYSYKSGKRKGHGSMAFRGADVVKISAKPKRKIKKDTVPLNASHKSKVLDPVSTLLFTVANGASTNGREVCNRTQKVFDGRNRMNLTFFYKGKGDVRPEGYSGEVYKCGVTYHPIAGHRTSNKGTKFMRARRDIEVQMARIGSSNAFGLVGFSIPTRAGFVTGQADRFVTR